MSAPVRSPLRRASSRTFAALRRLRALVEKTVSSSLLFLQKEQRDRERGGRGREGEEREGVPECLSADDRLDETHETSLSPPRRSTPK